jgi:5-methylcytosine-specific restriction endonuclease McrA
MTDEQKPPRKRKPRPSTAESRAYQAAWRRAWRAAHPEAAKKRKRKPLTPEQKARRAANGKAYRAANRERIRAWQTAWYQANREAKAERSAQWWADHKDWSTNRNHRRRADGRAFVVLERDWRRLLERYRHCCAYCGAPHPKLQREHVIPLSRGGAHSIGNLLPSCPSCNLRKKDMLLVEWHAKQRRDAAH